MKKIFKFFMGAAIVAAGFTGCSSEEVNPNPGPDPGPEVPVVEGTPTYATFTFNVSQANSTTRANATASDMDTGAIGDNDDYTINKIRLLVFNSSNQLEANVLQDVTAPKYQTATVRLMSGPKKILVLANEHASVSTAFSTAAFKTLDPDNSATVASTYADVITNISATAINLFEVGGSPTTAPIDSTDFNGGSAEPYFDIDRVIGTVASGDYPYMMSNPDDGTTYTLQPGISETDSKNATAGTNDKNHFKIAVKRAVAKGVITYDDSRATILTTLDGLGKLTESSLKYGMDNVNRSVYLFQQFDGTTITSAYYDIPNISGWPIPAPSPARPQGRQDFYPYFYKMYNISNAIAKASSPTTAVYFTENTKSAPMNGNITYAAIEAQFTPADGKWASAIDYDNSLKQITIVTGTNYSDNDLWAVLAKNDKLSYSNNNKFDNIYLFPSAELANKALYLITYGTLFGQTQPRTSELFPTAAADYTSSWQVPADMKKYIDKYTGRKCYYRMDMGEGTLGGSFRYSVERNAQYFAKITGFKTIGVNDRRKLDDNPYEPKDAITHVTATIEVKNWDEKTMQGEI